ncbi:DDE-type integrase/transposase/recombinase [Dechloromonas sp. XY25]|uniref:DDE-type integrase/transposase/recombinase n=1 Tax=Dechloromonas hankyongensis TaxID=2908002 RepID=A0ABS9JY78_9RHOO|nr:Mu transposase C-terminal domain-containing protein [Dechloromonas hankyongensis]MCG2575867.1 DDE-type integrase/transposase/recombinase [Dechloromonas hankyongensis]
MSATEINFVPGSIVRKGTRRLVVVDCEGFDAVIARELGTTKVVRVLVRYLSADSNPKSQVFVPPDLVTVDAAEWGAVVERFTKLKPLIDATTRRNLSDVKAVAESLRVTPCTIYRWIEKYQKAGRLSVFLRKPRSDCGEKRLSEPQEAIIQKAIETKYLTAEKPDVETVIEEVRLLCSLNQVKKPHDNTVRNRINEISERTKIAKRRSKKIAAEIFEPIRGHFPGADYPLAVVQIDHTPMDVIVVDEHDRLPIDRPYLTIVIDVFSRMIIGFAIYLEKPSAFTTGLAISHAVLPKEEWLRELDVNVEWPCWGKMRKIHLDNAREFRGTVVGRACEEYDITVEHRPKGQPRYGGHVERGFRTFMRRAHRLKGTTFSNVAEKQEYDAEGRAILTRKELERWFTIYIAKYYPHKFHRGIKNTPMAKYWEGIHGSENQIGIGLPARMADPHAFMLEFLPFESRTVQEYGVVLNWIYYYDDALRPWIKSKDPNNSKEARKFLVRFNPRDMREIYFLDPVSKTFITIPYRDRSHPPVSLWEVLAAERKLREKGYKNVNEALLFEALLEMRDIEEEAERKTKKARRAKEKREQQPVMPTRIRKSPLASALAPPNSMAALAETQEDDDNEVVSPAVGIVEADIDE